METTEVGTDPGPLVSSCLAAFPAWAILPPARRLARVKKLARLVSRRQDAIARAIVADTGKPLTEAVNQEITAALGFVRDGLGRYPAALRQKSYLYIRPGFWSKSHRLLVEPLGLVAVIGPSNYPFLLPFMHLTAALVCGDGALVKPSERSPAVTQVLIDLVGSWSGNEGIAQVVPGGPDTANMLISHPAVKKVLFTGSTAAGREVAALCGRMFKPCVLELGGQGVALVCEDADITLAARGIVWSACTAVGRSCVGTRRILAAPSVCERLEEALQRERRSLRRGNPLDPDIDIAAAAPDPVPEVEAWSSAEAAVAAVNASPFGLSASIWSANARRAQSLARALDVGIVWINDAGAGEPHFPWGGRRDSGWGRLLSSRTIGELTQMKVISQERRFTASRKLWWYPYTARKLRLFRSVNRFL